MQTRFKKNINFAIIALLLLGCVSCQPHPFLPPALSKIASYAVAAKELPAGWKFTGENWVKNFGGQSYLVAYGIDNDNIIRLTDTISMYDDEEQRLPLFVQKIKNIGK